MSKKEQDVLAMFDKSVPKEEDLFEVTTVNYWPWLLLIAAIGLVFWLSVALVNAENQRNALMTKQCEDPLFKGTPVLSCLQTVHSREHWWQHLFYAMGHVEPDIKTVERPPLKSEISPHP